MWTKHWRDKMSHVNVLKPSKIFWFLVMTAKMQQAGPLSFLSCRQNASEQSLQLNLWASTLWLHALSCKSTSIHSKLHLLLLAASLSSLSEQTKCHQPLHPLHSRGSPLYAASLALSYCSTCSTIQHLWKQFCKVILPRHPLRSDPSPCCLPFPSSLLAAACSNLENF